jgi:hypothetical protein
MRILRVAAMTFRHQEIVVDVFCSLVFLFSPRAVVPVVPAITSAWHINREKEAARTNFIFPPRLRSHVRIAKSIARLHNTSESHTRGASNCAG